MDIRIDRLTEDDLDRVVEIERVSYPAPWSRGLLAGQIGAGLPFSDFAVRVDGDLAGYIFFYTVVDELHILNIAVAPTHRRHGLGRRLLEACIDWGQRQGVTAYTLEVRRGNLPAQGLYRTLGFDHVGTRSGYYLDNGEDAMIMTMVDRGAVI